MARTPNSPAFSEAARLTLADGTSLSRHTVEQLLKRHDDAAPRLGNLWAYYRNPMSPCSGSGDAQGRSYRLAQERGLPPRVVGLWDRRGPAARFAADDRTWHRKEVVVENDIAWRIQTMVDFMFGKPIVIASMAADPALAQTIERVLAHIWDSSGGIALLQDMALMGHVYGHVDLLVRVATDDHAKWSLSRKREESSLDSTTSPSTPTSTPSSTSSSRRSDPPASTIPASDSLGGVSSGGSVQQATPRGAPAEPAGIDARALDRILERAATTVRIEVIEPPRGVALPSASDYRDIDAYLIRSRHESRDTQVPQPASGTPLAPLWRLWRGAQPPIRPDSPIITTTELFAGPWRQLYQQTPDGRTTLIDEGPALVTADPHDRPPIVHIQNISQPFAYEGLGEVEPLIPLQDELNTRLSDRASRVTLQSFKMFLAKGIDGASAMPVAPGIVWSTDNPDATVEAFGGDAASPSEDRHIDEIREAMDKCSAVPPLASGVVRAKIGNLSSENALRITLLGLMSKTSRKRITYGRGLVRASQLVLEALDRLGILHTTPQDRALRVDWADPIPRDEQLALLAAQKKVDLGVPRNQVLAELGYSPDETPA